MTTDGGSDNKSAPFQAPGSIRLCVGRRPSPPGSVAPFNPTRHDATAAALSLLDLGPDDVLFDLGCGDGRVLIEAARDAASRGVGTARFVGVELDPTYAERARRLVEEMQEEDESVGDVGSSSVGSRVLVRRGDLMEELRRRRGDGAVGTREEGENDDHKSNAEEERKRRCLSLSQLTVSDDATAIFVYLLPKGLAKIGPLLEEIYRRRRKPDGRCDPPLRIVAYTFSLRGWTPVEVDRSTKAEIPIYLYDETSVPSLEKPEGGEEEEKR